MSTTHRIAWAGLMVVMLACAAPAAQSAEPRADERPALERATVVSPPSDGPSDPAPPTEAEPEPTAELPESCRGCELQDGGCIRWEHDACPGPEGRHSTCGFQRPCGTECCA